MVKTFALAALIALVNAGAQDLCTAGSDAECQRFGTNMCCAHIQYTYEGDFQDFHACASRTGIEFNDGKIYEYGFSGTWYCDYATSLQTAAALVAVVTLF
mmetsp:Transcript_22310/g.15905  ORF Transcript_22310/g.15905 Transcript_22310/m.15905 type:complete len:100 (-) Transcript_22310:151-450(-)|eukprot:CAMPEP_0116887992 /NCGR_PEP_ID=MMETSP0463-20121206/22759_1 /TAXON_ID=181622 /ORGANISM="Strombidinopsis sp, Strain SopsisLIS2011" /LENGTH=99 /DNA_ID=CAMNT_0004551801 /DNA_START=20 /DNA_END=319 /DNA_ORIENTATION=-